MIEVQYSHPKQNWHLAHLWQSSHEDYWQISPKVIAGLMLVLALGVSIIGEARHETGVRSFFELSLYAGAGVIWLVDNWQPMAARWLAVFLCLVILASGTVLIWGASLWMLLFLPILVAMLLLGAKSALLVAVAASLLYLFARPWDAAPAAGPDPFLVLFSIWCPTALLSLFVTRIQQLLDQWSDILLRARAEVEETRDRKLERESMLAELTLANRNLQLMNERVNAMRALAEEAHQAKAAFVANISHEFRTPLNMVIGMIDTIMQKPEVYGETIPRPLLQDLEIVRRNAGHLADMVNDVLDMSQSETGQLHLRREWSDLGSDLRKSVAVVQPLLDKKRLRLDLAIADDLPKLYYDRPRIRQVVLNLVSNAARYTDAGSICVLAKSEEDHLLVSVRDTGLGIPTDDLEKVFEPFYQASNVGERSREGSGLGLNICRQIVTLHDGRIWVESQEGEGTTVSFRLPLRPPLPASVAPLRWLDQDWVYVHRAQWPNVPKLPNRQRVVVFDEANVFQRLFGSDSAHVELLYVDNLDAAARLLTQVPAHALLVNAHSSQALLAHLGDAVRKAGLPDLPLIGCTIHSPRQEDDLPGVCRFLTKPVQYTQLAQAVTALGRTVRRVLVVDDNLDTARLFARMVSLISEKIDTQVVHNGSDALAQMRMAAPDLVLLDLVMPQMDGRHFLQTKNADPLLSPIPVIVISAEDPGPKLQGGTLLMAALQRSLPPEVVLQLAGKLATVLGQPAETLDREPG